MHYLLQWDGGPGAVIDVQQQDDKFLLRYDAPFRLTLRRGVEELQITPDDLDGPVTALRRVAGSTGITSTRGGPAPVPADEILDRLADEGDSLFQLMLPRFVAADLAGEPLFLEVGTDEHLLHVPWELMRDASDFICLRHAMGRYVNLLAPIDVSRTLDRAGELRVLLVCVSKPQPSEAVEYDKLTEADAEFTAISSLFVERNIHFVPLKGQDATKERISKELKGDERYTIIHFTGHGHVDETTPKKSGLVLFDGILTTGMIGSYLKHAPALAFINGCETARTTARPAAGALGVRDERDLPISHLTRVFGIARPFLQQGSYVLGTRWRVSDTSAATFATTFYASLLDGDPVGEATMKARRAIYDPATTDLSWASYVFYGDPRLIIRLETSVPPTGEDTVTALVPPQNEPEEVSLEPGDRGLPAGLRDLAARYVELRANEPAGSRGTVLLEQLLDQVRQQAIGVAPAAIAEALRSADDGDRIVGVAAARTAPSSEVAEPLMDVLTHPRSTFEEYQALTTVREIIDTFEESQRDTVRQHLLGQLGDERFLDSDRAYVAREALAKLSRGSP